MELTKAVQPDKDGNYPLTRGNYGVRAEVYHRVWWNENKWEALEDADFWHDGKLVKWANLPKSRQERIISVSEWKVFDPDWGWV